MDIMCMKLCPVIGENLTCTRERGNRCDIFAVAVQKDDSTTVGHVPKGDFMYLQSFNT